MSITAKRFDRLELFLAHDQILDPCGKLSYQSPSFLVQNERSKTFSTPFELEVQNLVWRCTITSRSR